MAEVQCRQIVRAGHRCPRAARRDDFCDAHRLMRFEVDDIAPDANAVLAALREALTHTGDQS